MKTLIGSDRNIRLGQRWQGGDGPSTCMSSKIPIHFLKTLFAVFAMTLSKASGITVNGVLFSAPSGAVSNIGVATQTSLPSTTCSRSVVVFIHGRLEADPASDDLTIPRPAELYSDFCKGLAASMMSDVFLVDYHEHYRDWRREPRDLELGPVSSAVGETIRKHIKSYSDPMNATATSISVKITLVSFSMGAAIVLKLLKNSPMFESASVSVPSSILKNGIKIERAILVEPVWRCWLPFAVSRAAEARYSANAKKVEISKVPSLVLVGANDLEVRHDINGGMGSNGTRNLGQSVARCLQPFLPNLSTIDIAGGNHFGLCSGPPKFMVFASEGLSSGKSSERLRKEMIDHISEFSAQSQESDDDSDSDSTAI